jgi:hypothetical protein
VVASMVSLMSLAASIYGDHQLFKGTIVRVGVYVEEACCMNQAESQLLCHSALLDVVCGLNEAPAADGVWPLLFTCAVMMMTKPPPVRREQHPRQLPKTTSGCHQVAT